MQDDKNPADIRRDYNAAYNGKKMKMLVAQIKTSDVHEISSALSVIRYFIGINSKQDRFRAALVSRLDDDAAKGRA